MVSELGFDQSGARHRPGRLAPPVDRRGVATDCARAAGRSASSPQALPTSRSRSSSSSASGPSLPNRSALDDLAVSQLRGAAAERVQRGADACRHSSRSRIRSHRRSATRARRWSAAWIFGAFSPYADNGRDPSPEQKRPV